LNDVQFLWVHFSHNIGRLQLSITDGFVATPCFTVVKASIDWVTLFNLSLGIKTVVPVQNIDVLLKQAFADLF
jgi:hypothetical protein